MRVYLDDKRTIDMSHGPNKGLGILYGDPKSWTIVRTLDDFKDVIESNFDDIDIISFDHDLGLLNDDGSEQDGKDAANFLVEYCMDNNKLLPDWYVHSDNTVGIDNIAGLLLGFMKSYEGRIDSYAKYNKGFVKGKLI
jgi:hypothetical protein